MYCGILQRTFSFAVSVLFVSVAAFATTPVVRVSSPANNSQVDSPVNYVARVTSPQCSKGIASIRIYTAPNVSAYTINAGQLDTYLTLSNGTYNTVVQAWDKCGGVAKVNVKITVAGRAKLGGFLYITNSNYFFGNTINDVNSYVILASNGALAPTGQGPVRANVFPLSVTSDKGGYRLYVGDYITGDVFAYFINRSNGYLTPVPGSPFPVNHSVTAVAVHPSGKFVFATRDENAAGDGVAVFQVQNNGSLKAAPGSPYSTQNGPQALVVDATGKYLYVADATGYIDAFEIDQTAGALTPLPGSPYKLSTPNPSCSAFPFDIINPLGKYLYTANAFNDSISGYTIEKTTGTLTQIAGSPWPDEGGCAPICPPCAFNPEALAVDGSGKFLYGINGDMEEIAIYSINSSGALNFIKYTPNTSACSGPIRTDITGNYIYAFGCGFQSGGVGSSIVAFAINHSTGDLSPLPSSPYPVIQGYPMGLTVTP